MPILKLRPSYKDYLWGGTRLMTQYGKDFSGDLLAESWELSCHRDGESVIVNGKDAGKTLKVYIEENGKDVLGSNCILENDLPILIKLIDAKEKLSIQVHPDDGYAMSREGQKGKTEMWYIIDCGADSYIYYGFSRKISKEEFEKRVQDQTLTRVLNKISVKKGDVFLIESGTVHAIGEDILLAEIQENSNLTYRIYDYGRVGKDGQMRRLDIEKALNVVDINPLVNTRSFSPHLVTCGYFTVDKLFLDGRYMKRVDGFAGQDSFVHFLILDGFGSIQTREDIQMIKKGDSIFLPAGSGAFELEGQLEILLTRI